MQFWLFARRALISGGAARPAAIVSSAVSLSHFPFNHLPIFLQLSGHSLRHYCDKPTKDIHLRENPTEADDPRRPYWPYRRRAREHRCNKDRLVTLQISLMEAFQGCTKTLMYETDVLCGTCCGTRSSPGERFYPCTFCQGLGWMCHYNKLLCPICNGLRLDAKSLCKPCKVEGVAKGMKTISLEVPPGVDDGECIKVQGGGADDSCGGPGDLYVTITVKEDPTFRREKSDIHVDATLQLLQAIYGGTIQVPTLTGNVTVKVNPGTQPGNMVVISGKGMKAKNSGCHGDQYVHFNVRIPQNATEKQHMLREFFKLEQAPGISSDESDEVF